MKAPLTGNSITDRVVYTGLYVPDATWHAGAEGVEIAEPDQQVAPDAEARVAAQEA